MSERLADTHLQQLPQGQWRGAMSKKKADFSPGTMGCHEALHMASFLADAIDREILNHPAVVADQKWKKLAGRSFNAMAKLYQEIGGKHL